VLYLFVFKLLLSACSLTPASRMDAEA